MTWPTLHVVDGWGSEAMNGKADDFATAVVVTLLLAGLLAAGWLRPLWAVAPAVFAYGVAVPHAYEAMYPRQCPPGVSGIDCLPASFGAAWFATAGVLVVLLGCLLRLAVGARAVEVLPRRRRLGSGGA